MRQISHYIYTGRDMPNGLNRAGKLKFQHDLRAITGLTDGLDDGRIGHKTVRAMHELALIKRGNAAAIKRAKDRLAHLRSST